MRYTLLSSDIITPMFRSRSVTKTIICRVCIQMSDRNYYTPPLFTFLYTYLHRDVCVYILYSTSVCGLVFCRLVCLSFDLNGPSYEIDPRGLWFPKYFRLVSCRSGKLICTLSLAIANNKILIINNSNRHTV